MMMADRQYVATTDPNWKEKYAYSPYDERHVELLREFVAHAVKNAPEHAVKHVMDKVEENFYNEGILIFPAHRVLIFDTVYDYLKENNLWQEIFASEN